MTSEVLGEMFEGDSADTSAIADAVLRYYLNYENVEDFCRGLLILFFPFRNEFTDIHKKGCKRSCSSKLGNDPGEKGKI